MSTNHFLPTDAFDAWFNERREAHRFVIERIPFQRLEQWGFDPQTGNLGHVSGRFFTIEGLSVDTNFGSVGHWEQPIINQPEIGILGLLIKAFDGVPHVLMQAKMEPGNINMIQLSPTLQATHSNYTRVHRGKAPHYLDYFLDAAPRRVVADTLQSEQGARFLHKRNRNLIVMTDRDVEVLPDFRWFRFDQLRALLRRDNLVNMDVRTVLSCLPPRDDGGEFVPDAAAPGDAFGHRLQASGRVRRGRHTFQELLNWFTAQRMNFHVHARTIPLRDTRHWQRTDDEIRHESGRFFSVIACRIEAGSREVTTWTQPLVQSAARGLIGFVVREIDGVLHLLVQARPEAGIYGEVELGPTVSCAPDQYADMPPASRPPFLDYLCAAQADRMRYDAVQSEEGGRFFREENRNLVVEAGEDFPLDVPERYIWMTVRQLKEFIRHSHDVNVQARCLLAAMGAW